MIFKVKTYDQKIEEEKNWHKVFAFWPFLTDDGCLHILSYYERRLVKYSYNWAGETKEYETRRILK